MTSLKEELERSKEKLEKEREREFRGNRDRASNMGERQVSSQTNSDVPRLLNSRVFIGNLPSDRVTRTDLEDIFKGYGKILGVSILRGFGFVQYDEEDDARVAVREENGGLIKGNRVDVKMAVEGRRQSGEGRGGGRGRGVPRGRGRRFSPPPHYRERSPSMDYRDRSPTHERDMRYDDVRRPYDAYGHEPDSHFSRRDPHMGPASRDSYREPRDSFPPYHAAPHDTRADAQCAVILMSRKAPLRTYGELVESRMRRLHIATTVTVLPEDVPLLREIENCSRKRLLYAIVLTDDNEHHNSMTLNILHGTPQEHRNMPLEQAVTFITRNFEAYMAEMKEKALAPLQPVVAMEKVNSTLVPPGVHKFVPPDEHKVYLFNLLADNRFLSLEELNEIIEYLVERRACLADTMGSSVPKTEVNREEEVLKQQQDLKNKILNIFGPTEAGGVQSPAPQQPKPAQATPTGGGATSINFDNPSVQQALNTLISSGPNLLKNISAASTSNASVGNGSTMSYTPSSGPQLMASSRMERSAAGHGPPMGQGQPMGHQMGNQGYGDMYSEQSRNAAFEQNFPGAY